MPDWVIGGLSLPPFIWNLLIAFMLYMLIKPLLYALGANRYIWYIGLFNVVLLVLLVALVTGFRIWLDWD